MVHAVCGTYEYGRMRSHTFLQLMQQRPLNWKVTATLYLKSCRLLCWPPMEDITTLRRQLQLLYPLEIKCKDQYDEGGLSEEQPTDDKLPKSRRKTVLQRAETESRDRVRTWLVELNNSWLIRYHCSPLYITVINGGSVRNWEIILTEFDHPVRSDEKWSSWTWTVLLNSEFNFTW